MAASIRDVAQRSGVSIGTVSNAINRPGEVAADTLVRVQQAIAELGYVPNRAARALRGGPSSTVGFVVMSGQNPFFTDIVRGAEDEAAVRGIAVLYGNADEDADRENLYLDLFEAQEVRGILISPFGDIDARLRTLAQRGIRPVLIDRFGDKEFSSVSVDNVEGGRLAVEHLIAQGRRKIAVVGGLLPFQQALDRLAGARLAAAQSSVDVEIRSIPLEGMSVEAGVASGSRLLAREVKYWPDAIFAVNDLVALGILQALTRDGRIRVPEDIAIIGFDDISFAAAAAVPLSSMRQPSRMIGRTAMRILLEEEKDHDVVPRHTVFQAELVARASTGVR